MNKDICKINGSASMELIVLAKKLKDEGVDIIGLGGGEPDFDTPTRIKEKMFSEVLRGNTHYAVGQGLFLLRERITRKLLDDNNIKTSPDNIFVTPGAKMAIYLAVRACINSGDEVLIPTPSWVSYSEIVKASGGVPVEVPLSEENNYLLTADILEKHSSSKTRMIIVCTPNNPTGRVLSKLEIDELSKFTKNKDIIVLSDEIYEKICFIDNFLSPGAFIELADRTITVNGFSKAYAMTGWRLGYLVVPDKYVSTINKLYTHTITGTSPFIQEAAIVALDCFDDVERMRRQYFERKKYFINALSEIPGVEVLEPEGAFYAWCKFDVDGNVSRRLLEEAKVIGVPGNAYGTGFEEYIRFTFASSMDELKEAINRINKFMKEKRL